MYKTIIKPILFLFDPELAHKITMHLFQMAMAIPLVPLVFRKMYVSKQENLKIKLMGLTFSNPIGLAAGFDKDGIYYHTMTALGFGFIEIGTVTPKAQDGNPTPRLFRLPADEALINRMGFNNKGADQLAERLQKQGKPKDLILGINIGKNKTTPNDQALEDYIYCFEKLFPYADYFVVNVSSPNTPDLRALQDKEPLTTLLTYLQKINLEKSNPKPILLKIAPDLNNEQLTDIVEIVKSTAIAGIIATNTTVNRSGLKTSAQTLDKIGAGGLSGNPLRDRSTAVIRFLRAQLSANVVIIGAGGIRNGKDAAEKLKAGADLLQVYTGLIYEGPNLVKEILNSMNDN
ncbi:MAG: quinone-dependent dihydroorotate dehydrogenase [Saprospiraceae bacterium]